MLGLLLLCAVLSWLPGYALLAHVQRLSAAERVACSGCLSAAVCGVLALWCFLFDAPILPGLVLLLALSVLLLVLAYRRGLALGLDAAGRQVGCFWLLFLAELVVLETLLPSFGGANWLADWWVHFHRSLVYANLVPVHDVARTCVDLHVRCVAPVYDHGVMTARMPLFNLLSSIPLSLDGGRLAAYQIGAMTWCAVLAGPVVLLAQRRGLQAGWLAGMLLLLNPFLVHLAIYPWSKVLCAAFEVLAVYWLLRLRDGAAWAGAGVACCLGLAVFAHGGAVIYVLAVALYLVIWRRPSIRVWRGIACGALIALLVILPWAAWGIHTYGWQAVVHASPIARDTRPTLGLWIGKKIHGLASSFVPMPLAHALEANPFSGTEAVWFTVNAALQFWFDVYPGALGLVAGLLLLRWYPRAHLIPDTRRLGWCIAICAALGAVLLDPGSLSAGVASDAMAGTVVLGITLLAGLVPAKIQSAVLIAIGLEAGAVFALYLGYLRIGPWESNPNSLVLAGMGQQMLSASLGHAGVAVLILVTLVLIAAAPRFGAPSRLPVLSAAGSARTARRSAGAVPPIP